MDLFAKFLKAFWEIILVGLFGLIIQVISFFLHNKKAVFLCQTICLDLGPDGRLNQIKVKSTITNAGRELISKYNHLLRSDLPSLGKAKIFAFDDEGLLPEPEMIEKNPQSVDFYVLFRKALKPNEKYAYTWASFGIEKFFDFSRYPLTWTWTPITKVLEMRFEVYHPPGFKLTSALVVIKNTGEEIEVAQTKMVSYNREATEIILKNRSQGSYEIRWSYEK